MHTSVTPGKLTVLYNYHLYLVLELFQDPEDHPKPINHSSLFNLEKDMATTPVFLPGESHGQRSLADYSPWGFKESDTTESHTHTHTHT